MEAMARKFSKKKAGTADVVRIAEKPKLLSGDNPQIAKGDGDAFVQAYIDLMPRSNATSLRHRNQAAGSL